ncbi:hypothetical protein ILUMI_07986, partial [Ignelater luminosus]
MAATGILSFCEQFYTVDLAISYLRERNILRRDPPPCTRNDCNRLMTQVKCSAVVDGVTWRCPRHKGSKKSIRTDSFVAKSNLQLHQFILLMYTWALSIPPQTQEILCGLTKKTVVEWNQFFRGVCSWWLTCNPVQLGGPNQIVEIESLIFKQKYNRGHMVPKRWVFGLYDVEAKIGVAEFVEDRSREILLPIIERYVTPGSIIHSDCWAAYGKGAISALPVVPPYEHVSVNSSENFVDPETGACTNRVKAFWKAMKMKLKAINSTTAEMLPSYMDEFMWRQQFGKNTEEAYENLITHITMMLP